MTAEKAKELLQQDLDDPGSVFYSDLNQAQQLGIEAIEELERLRLTSIASQVRLLPSETKE